MLPAGCSALPVRIYQPTALNFQEEKRPHLRHRDGTGSCLQFFTYFFRLYACSTSNNARSMLIHKTQHRKTRWLCIAN